ncbi:MAG: ParB/RepB/Spo0J family partition protein, partial [Oscillospiraceae bacterium]|nr:ParB/RepB/Spo0J family partition protein [Oscillospiraceae bacterium]
MKLYSKLKTAGQIILIPQEKIMPNPSQPRKSYNKEELEGLAGSIKENGILQPLNVRANGTGEYELISGERRLRAARLAGFPSVPCVIMDTNEKTSAVFALIENMQRQDLNYFEEAAAIERLSVKHGLMQEDIAKLLGKSQSALSNKIRLLKLPEDMRIKIINAGLTERHARALLRLENDESRLKVFSTIVEKHLNVAETDKM